MKTILAIAAISALVAGAIIAAANAQTMPQTAFNKTLGNVQLVHNWSQIAMLPAGSAKNITALCDPGAYPTGGGYSLGSPDLQVTGSHAYAAPNGTAGWLVSISNNNATAPLPASVDVICLSEAGATATTPPQDNMPASSSNEDSGTKVVITSNSKWSGAIEDSDFKMRTVDGSGDKTFPIVCEAGGIYSLSFQKLDKSGDLTVAVVQGGDTLKESTTSAAYGIAAVSGEC